MWHTYSLRKCVCQQKVSKVVSSTDSEMFIITLKQVVEAAGDDNQ